MFDDDFLDDLDLLNEMLLTEDDAWRLYNRGEIKREQLNRYLEKHKNIDKNEQKPSSLIKIVILVIVLAMACIFISMLLGSCY